MSLFWGLLWNIKRDVKESWNFSIGYQSVLKFAWEYSVGYAGGKWKFQYNIIISVIHNNFSVIVLKSAVEYRVRLPWEKRKFHCW